MNETIARINWQAARLYANIGDIEQTFACLYDMLTARGIAARVIEIVEIEQENLAKTRVVRPH